MKKISIALTIFFIAVGVCYAEGYRLSGQAGEYSIVVMFDKNKPSEGKNRIQIKITDIARRPVRNSLVEIDYFMPSLPGKPSMMEYRTDAKPIRDIYEAILDLPMKGVWRATMMVTTKEKHEKLTVEFEVK